MKNSACAVYSPHSTSTNHEVLHQTNPPHMPNLFSNANQKKYPNHTNCRIPKQALHNLLVEHHQSANTETGWQADNDVIKLTTPTKGCEIHTHTHTHTHTETR
ncbi:hypothetical protein M758_11G167000, partial [Ceratodon purpureus]